MSLARGLPDFIVIGAEKSGSTFLVRRLMQHPQIFMPSPLRTQFLSDPLDAASWEEWRTLLGEAPDGKMKGMRASRYFSHPQCAAFLHANAPGARLVAILRHPVARAISAYYHRMMLGVLPVAPLNDGLARLLNGENADCFMCRAVLADGLYGTNLARFLGYFSREQLLVLLLDDFQPDVASVAARQVQKLYGFLGADDFAPPELGHRENAGSYSLARVRVRRAYRQLQFACSPNSLQMTWRHPPLAPRILASLLRRTDDHLLRPLLRHQVPPLAPSLAERLLELYRPEVERLENLLNRSLDVWKTWQAHSIA